MPRPLSIALSLALAVLAAPPLAIGAEAGLPAPMAQALKAAGLSVKGVGVYVLPVDQERPAPLAAWNAEQALPMASTAKLVTSLAALRLLGEQHQWPSLAYAAQKPAGGRLAGDLVIAGGPGGVTAEDLRRWFRHLREQGLQEVGGRIVLQNVELLQDPPGVGAAGAEGGAEPAVLRVLLQPGARGRAQAQLRPALPGVQLLSEVSSGSGGRGCAVYARWKSVQPPVAWVSGRWDAGCGTREAATLAAPAGLALAPVAPPSAASVAAQLWRDSGGRVRGGVVEQRSASVQGRTVGWMDRLWTSLPERLQDINKPSLNAAARRLLLALADGAAEADPLLRAQRRLQGWLQAQGLRDDDLRIELGSGQSHNERGKARALAGLLHDAWRRGDGLQSLLQSLPVAGVDGTLAHRLRGGPAEGRAFLKTGTLSDTRALAGYVVGRSGRVYAVAALVNGPQAGRATPALDSLVEWVVRNG